jgi:hypothetical protein
MTKKKRIGLFLPLPWDKSGQLISSVDPDHEETPAPPGDANIVRPPDSLWKGDADTPKDDEKKD